MSDPYIKQLDRGIVWLLISSTPRACLSQGATSAGSCSVVAAAAAVILLLRAVPETGDQVVLLLQVAIHVLPAPRATSYGSGVILNLWGLPCLPCPCYRASNVASWSAALPAVRLYIQRRNTA